MSDKIGNREILIIRNIIVGCEHSDATNPALDGLAVTMGEADTEFNLQRISEQQWTYDGQVEICLSNQLTILLSSGTEGELSRISIEKEDLGELSNTTGRGHRLKRKMHSLTGGPKAALSVEIGYDLDNKDMKKDAVSEDVDNSNSDEWETEDECLPDEWEAEDLEKTIQNLQLTVKLTPEGHSDLSSRLNDLAISYYSHFQQTGNVADLTEAIHSLQQAVKLISEEHSDLPGWLTNLGTFYKSCFDITGDMTDVAEAIWNIQQAVKLTPESHSDLPITLNSLGTSYQSRFEMTGDMTDLVEAIQIHQKAVALAPVGHPDLPALLNNLGISYAHRFERIGVIADLAEAIQNKQKAVKLTPKGHPALPGILNSLGITYQSCFERTGDMPDLEKAIQNHQQAVKLTSVGHPALPHRLSNLGTSYQSRFERTGDMPDLKKAIYNHQQAVKFTPVGHSALPALLNNIAMSYRSRFERTGDKADLTKAIQNLQQAVKLTPTGHLHLGKWLNNLGISYQSCFERTGNMEDITKAIQNLQQAVKLTPNAHLVLPGRLNSLGNSYRSRFERTEHIPDIAEAIQNLQQAIKLTPIGHSALPGMLSNLGISYQRRFEKTEDIADLAEAIQNLQQAVKLTTIGNLALPGMLNSLGITYQYHFEKTKDITYLEKAIENHEQAVKLTPINHPALPSLLNNLAVSYQSNFAITEDIGELKKAIQNHEQAVKLTPVDHPTLPNKLNNLENSYQKCFEKTEKMENLTKAILNQQQAVKLTSKGHPDLPQRLNNLGVSYKQHFDYTQNYNSLSSAISHFHLAATSKTGSLAIRLDAVQSWIQLCELSPSCHSQLLTAYELVIDLLSLIAGLHTLIQNWYEQVTQFSELPLAAAAAAISFKQLPKAIQWLEQGRCIVWNQLQQLRAPLSILYSQYPDLANQLLFLSNTLENAGSRNQQHLKRNLLDDKISWEKDSYYFLKLATERDELLKNIRNKPDFQDFLQPKGFSDIISAVPFNGLVVVLNIHKDHCDALVLSSNTEEPLHIPLNTSYTEISKMAENMHDYLLDNYVRSQNSSSEFRAHLIYKDNNSVSNISVVLLILWEKIIKPILNTLSLSPKSDFKAKQRIWWCPTGPLAFLPIHAAGIYVHGKAHPGKCLSDFAISSYIPNLSALLPKYKTFKETKDGVLMVSQPYTPHLEKIPFAKDEVEEIKNQLSVYEIQHLILEGEDGTVSQVSQLLEKFTCVHLACHASQNLKDPLKNADFAFLSACQTSTGDQKLSEEVVHLAAGMLAAGYRSAIATMWSIPDKFGPTVAKSFYERLLQSGNGKLNSAGAAEALHCAIESLKGNPEIYKLSDSLLAWVPYVHFGL